MENLVQFWWILPIVIFVFSGLVTVSQGYIDVVTMFGADSEAHQYSEPVRGTRISGRNNRSGQRLF